MPQATLERYQQKLKEKILNFLKEPVDYDRFDEILEKAGRTPEAAMAIQITAMTTRTLEFTATDDGEKRSEALINQSAENVDQAAEQLRAYEEKAERLRIQAKKAEKTGKKLYKEHNQKAEQQKRKAGKIDETLALLTNGKQLQ